MSEIKPLWEDGQPWCPGPDCPVWPDDDEGILSCKHNHAGICAEAIMRERNSLKARAERAEGMLDRTIERADGFLARAEKAEAALAEAEQRLELRDRAAERALKLWQEAHPDAEGWPDRAVNMVWLMEHHEQMKAALANAVDKCARLEAELETHKKVNP